MWSERISTTPPSRRHTIRVGHLQVGRSQRVILQLGGLDLRIDRLEVRTLPPDDTTVLLLDVGLATDHNGLGAFVLGHRDREQGARGGAAAIINDYDLLGVEEGLYRSEDGEALRLALLAEPKTNIQLSGWPKRQQSTVPWAKGVGHAVDGALDDRPQPVGLGIEGLVTGVPPVLRVVVEEQVGI